MIMMTAVEMAEFGRVKGSLIYSNVHPYRPYLYICYPNLTETSSRGSRHSLWLSQVDFGLLRIGECLSSFMPAVSQ